MIIGHRGAKGLAPENTLAALAAGLEAGVDELEIDVRVTQDGVPVVFHDRCFNRQRVSELTFSDFKKHEIDLATLEEAITFVKQRKPLLIEVKPNVPVQTIVKIIQEHLKLGWQAKDFRLASFSQRTLRELHRELPEIQKVVIENWCSVRATWRARELGTRRLSMSRRFVWWGFIRSMRARGYQLAIYTLDDPQKAKRWQKDGLWGVITDFPDRFKDV